MRPVLRIGLESGAHVDLPVPEAGEVARRGGVRVVITDIRETGDAGGVRRGMRAGLWHAHAVLVRVFGVGGLLAAAVLLIPPRRGRFSAPVYGAIALLAVLVLGRVAMLVLIDASSFSARSSRYVYPIVSLYGVAMLLLMREGLVYWTTTRSRRRREAPPR